MNKQQFLMALLPVGEYYGKTLTDGLIQVYYDKVKEWDACTFETMLSKHIDCPSQGFRWPTVAHLSMLLGTPASVNVDACAAFDNNPLIDGFSSFDANRESIHSRNQRKKAFANKKEREFSAMTTQEKITLFSNRLENNDRFKLGNDS